MDSYVRSQSTNPFLSTKAHSSTLLWSIYIRRVLSHSVYLRSISYSPPKISCHHEWSIDFSTNFFLYLWYPRMCYLFLLYYYYYYWFNAPKIFAEKKNFGSPYCIIFSSFLLLQIQICFQHTVLKHTQSFFVRSVMATFFALVKKIDQLDYGSVDYNF
jgi:hypothetical protein